MEPLTGILELSCEEVAASGIIDTSIVLWIDFDTRKIVIQGHVISLISILTIARLVGSTLIDVALLKPEFG